jgi:hypothetical protein
LWGIELKIRPNTCTPQCDQNTKGTVKKTPMGVSVSGLWKRELMLILGMSQYALFDWKEACGDGIS